MAYWVHDFHIARQPVKAKGLFPEPTEYLYPASRADHARETARVLGGECTPLYAALAQPAAQEGWQDAQGRTLDVLMTKWRKRDNELDRGDWLGVSEIAGRMQTGKSAARRELMRLASAGLIERQEYANGTFWRGILPAAPSKEGRDNG